MPTNMFGRLWRRGLVPVLLVILLTLALNASGARADGACGTCASAAPTPPTGARCVFADGSVDFHLTTDLDYMWVPAGATIKGDVQIWNGGEWLKAYPTNNDGNMGTVVHMVDGAFVRAEWGANVACDRSDQSIWEELAKVGCNSGCAIVKVWIYSGGKLHPWHTWTKAQLLSDPAHQNPSGGGQPTAAPTTTTPRLDCDDSIGRGKTVKVPAGCVVSGDIKVKKPTAPDSEYKVLYDDRDNTGLVVVLEEETDVFAPFGASYHSDGWEAVYEGVKGGGCAGGLGCAKVKVVKWPSLVVVRSE